MNEFDEFDPLATYDPFKTTDTIIADGSAKEVRVIPPASDPGGVANAYLAEQKNPIRRWRDSWYSWNGSYWCVIPDNELKSAFNAWLSSAVYIKEGVPIPWNPTRRKREEVLDTLAIHPQVMLSDSACEETRGIPFRNGVLSIDGVLRPHDNSPMRTWCVDADYAPNARCPTWENFMSDALDSDQIELAQEWAGYVLSGDVRAHKVMLAHGARRAGKSTYAAILAALLGDCAAATTPDDMLSPFGLEPISSARLVTMGDVRWSDRTTRRMLDRVRAISGGDAQTVNRKFRTALQRVSLPCRFMFTSNDLPAFGDDSGATLSRFLLLGFVHDHEGREDYGLLERLRGELPGIARWSLDGYRRLVGRGLHFVEPVRSRADRDDLRLDVEPVRVFCTESVVYDETEWVSLVDLYRAFVAWRGFEEDAGKSWFGRKVKAALPAARGTRQYVTRPHDPYDISKGTKRVQERGFSGIRLAKDS